MSAFCGGSAFTSTAPSQVSIGPANTKAAATRKAATPRERRRRRFRLAVIGRIARIDMADCLQQKVEAFDFFFVLGTEDSISGGTHLPGLIGAQQLTPVLAVGHAVD